MIISLESEWLYDLDLPISAETQRCATTLLLLCRDLVQLPARRAGTSVYIAIMEWTHKNGDRIMAFLWHFDSLQNV